MTQRGPQLIKSETTQRRATSFASNYLSAGRVLLTERKEDWRKPVEARLEELLRLNSGWDGYKAKPISLANAHFVLRMLESICSHWTDPPQIVPGVSGDVQVEWHTLQGDIELHVIKPNQVHAWCSKVDDAGDLEIELTNDFTDVAQWVQEITESPIAFKAAA